MKNILLVSHGEMAAGVRNSLEMIIGKQSHLTVVSLKPDGDNRQFEHDLLDKMKALNGQTLIIADLLGGTPANVAVKLFSESPDVDIIAGLSLPLAIEAVMNPEASSQDLVEIARSSTIDVKNKLSETEGQAATATKIDLRQYQEYAGSANIVNARIDERLIHGQVAGIWSTSLDTQRIIVANDEAASDSLQKSSLRMAAPTSMRLSVLPVEEAAKNIAGGKYGKQRLFLLFKNPSDALRFLEFGGPLPNLNVGNMSYKEGAREVTKSIQVMPEEEMVFIQLHEKGTNITAQLVPNDPIVNFIEKMKG
ncbi:PTS mannose/fructose/sorbose transporter subunit IIAB [Enterococcus sp. LJL90]